MKDGEGAYVDAHSGCLYFLNLPLACRFLNMEISARGIASLKDYPHLDSRGALMYKMR